MAPWPRAPVIPQLVDCKKFRDNRWVRHLSLTSCPTLPEELFPVLGEFVGVIGGQQLAFLERPKRALLDSSLEDTLAIPFVRFLPRKGNSPRG
ncbi:hypothetical protein TNCV_861901 [Trichonephila clavipes]|nr:hypothetical protein TNCV_861901 [Trichonephila clavipes]